MPIRQDNRKYVSRLRKLRFLFLAAVALLLLRLWQLSIIDLDYYTDLAHKNQIRTIPLKAPRGLIRDRDGRILVENSTGFELLLFRDKNPEVDETLDFLTSGLGLDREVLVKRLEGAQTYGRFEPVVLSERLSLENITYILAHKLEHPELQIRETPLRVYPYGELAAHLLGYVGEISLEELKLPQHSKNRQGDTVGKYGLEKTYNQQLTGVNGRRHVRVDSLGQALEDLGLQVPTQGQALDLTLDLDLQTVAEKSLGENPGAILAFDPNSGEILAMVSRPAFNPNHFATRITPKQWQDLLENIDHPLQNRVIQSHFSPGSIFKIVMALAGLEDGSVDLETSVTCNGAVNLYGHPFRCWSWKNGGHGTVRLVQAIQHSCNIYFYLLGQKLGIDKIAQFSNRVGLGHVTDIQLEGEVSGIVPSSEWKERTLGQRWYAGETISVSIGQGPVTVTPIQLARAIGAIATGNTPDLHLVAQEQTTSQPAHQMLRFHEKNLQAVREGMWRVVNEMGTGRTARVKGFDVCGKTGTVQTISRQTRSKLDDAQAERFKPNTWFVGFAPRDNPEIVVAVFVERGGSSGISASPAAGQVFKTYYRKKASDIVNRLENLQLAATSKPASKTTAKRRPDHPVSRPGGGE